jgi:hypothetical protein
MPVKGFASARCLDAIAQHLGGFGRAGYTGFLSLGLGDPANLFLAMGVTENFEVGEKTIFHERCFEDYGDFDGAHRFDALKNNTNGVYLDLCRSVR